MQGFSARRFALGLCFLCLLLPQVCPVKAQAAESASQTDIIFAEMNALTDGGELPFDKAGALGQRAVEALSPETLWRFGFDAFAKALRESFAVFPLLVAVILLSCVIGIYSENLGGGSRLAEFACLLGVCTIVVNAAVPVLTAVSGFLEEYAAFMTASNAAASLLMASSGSAGSGAAAASASAFTLGILQILAVRIVFPCVKTVLAFGFLSALSKTLDLSGFIGFLRNFCTWGLGVLFAVFGGIQAVCIRTAAGTDNAAVRGIRFTAARLIPIAGNMLSECFRTVLGAASVLKTAFGALGIAYLLYLVIPTLCTVVALKFAVLLALFCSKLMGTRPFTSFLESVGGALNILIAICVFAAANGMILFASCTETALTL